MDFFRIYIKEKGGDEDVSASLYSSQSPPIATLLLSSVIISSSNALVIKHDDTVATRPTNIESGTQQGRNDKTIIKEHIYRILPLMGDFGVEQGRKRLETI